MLDYGTESRLQAAREHAERLADDMRRSRRVTADVAGYPTRARLENLLRRLAHRGQATEGEPSVPAYDA
jgi:hypothetical protein